MFFTRPELAAKALQLGDERMRGLAIPEDLEMLCDVAQTLYLVNAEDRDEERVILDCLEVFDDLLRATRLSVPRAYQEALGEFSEHLSRGREYGEFLREGKREQVEDALLWCVGAITMKGKMVGE